MGEIMEKDNKLETKVRVNGNIVSELSEKIPTNIVALNELIKNAYDAGSPDVQIIVDSNNNILKIVDHGQGMNKEDIDALFHLSKSYKKYGSFNELTGRYVQGSKGLGFLSVFKFGKRVHWRTRKDKGYSFSVNFDDFIKVDNVTDYIINIEEDETVKTGTEIIICMDNYIKQLLLDFLKQEKNYTKIINSFTDEKFLISLNLDGKEYLSNSFKGIQTHFKERQLFFINYDSNEGIIKFYHNDDLAYEYVYPFLLKDFSVKIKLSIYNFLPRQKSNIYKLFYNNADELTPLVYINNNLFNNYEMFDPSIMKTVKTSKMLNQMIGYINIYSDSDKIQFNSDRTQFAQNELTENIIKFLREINIAIQNEGSNIKPHLMEYDFLNQTVLDEKEIDLKNLKKYINDDFYFKDKVNIAKDGNFIVFSLFGRSAKIQIIHKPIVTAPAEMILDNNKTKIEIPSAQIDLRSFIISATNSQKQSIINNVKILIEGEEVKNDILESVSEEKEIIVDYFYSDKETKLVHQNLSLKFISPKREIYGTYNDKEKLLYIKAKEGYKVNFDNTVSSLIHQINCLELNEFREVIACSLRVLFELSIKSLDHSSKHVLLKYNFAASIDNKISKIIEFVSEKSIRTEISNNTKISFNDLGNILIKDDFINAYKKSNLGPHSSTDSLTDIDIKFIAKKVAYFITFINEIINNPNIE